MPENKHIEINFKNNDKSNETCQNQTNETKLTIGQMPSWITEQQEEKQTSPLTYGGTLNEEVADSPVTEKIKGVVDFNEAKKMMKNMEAIYANADVETDPLYDPNNTNPNFNFNSDIRNYNIGTSDYSKHKIQPWDIWEDYNLNPWDADIVKRVLRKKELPGLDDTQSRLEDYKKIIHICLKRIDQINKGTVIL